MAKVQKQFVEFHDNIRLGQYDENATLREKREIVLRKLREGLERDFGARGEEPPKFSPFNQGSYAMNTGIRPVEGDYDIDVGVKFHVSKDKHGPLEVKQWVYDALENHTSRVEIRRNCVTVYYFKDGKEDYHVDLAVYAAGEEGRGPLYLAKGKANSDAKYKLWEQAEPEELIAAVTGRFSGDDAAQFRRAVRALKRWRQERFKASGNGAPVGIGLTLAAYYWFEPVKSVDLLQNKTEYDDRAALEALVGRMLANFQYVWHEQEEAWAWRLVVNVPVKPHTDVFARMTNPQMATFKEELEALKQALAQAASEPDTREACLTLRRKFGEDFPVPEESETAKQGGRSYVGSSSSA